jgi:hypothetical protein
LERESFPLERKAGEVTGFSFPGPLPKENLVILLQSGIESKPIVEDGV